jgi:hypothetical protein
MKVVYALIASLFLVGCATNKPKEPEKIVTIKYKYILLDVPADMTKIPDRIVVPSEETGTDKDVSKFIISTEGRILKLESTIAQIRQYLNDRIDSIKKNHEIKEEDIIR